MKKIVLFLALGLFLVNTAFAQGAPKLGYINSQDLLATMPDMKKAQTDLEAYGKTWQDQLEALKKEYETKVQKFQAEEKTMTEAVKEVRIKDITDLEGRIQSTTETAQQKIAAKREEILKPIYDKADKAIKDVAKEKNYDYVFDRVGLLYCKDGDDILPLVKAKLGIK